MIILLYSDSTHTFFACTFLACALEGPYLHAYLFMMCTLHQNIPFYVLFHLCALNSVLWKFLRFFLVWSLIYFPLDYMKTTRSWFCMYSRGKNSKVQIKKKTDELFFIIFFSKGPISLAKGMIWNNIQLSKSFKIITCSLGHSNAHFSQCKNNLLWFLIQPFLKLFGIKWIKNMRVK